MANPKIQLRHDTAANWSSANPVLLEGEFAYETDTKKIKVGDGSTAYNSLAYLDISLAQVDDLTVHGLLSSFAGDTSADTTIATATFGPASSSYKYETFLEHDAFNSRIYLGERQGVPSSDGTYVATPDSALVLKYELSGSDRGLYMVDTANYDADVSDNIYKILTTKDVDLSAINNVQEKLIAGKGIVINQTNNTISVNTEDRDYRVSIDNPSSNNFLNKGKLYNLNNIYQTPPTGRACGCNISIPMDDFTQIEFVQVCEKLGSLSSDDIQFIQLGDYLSNDGIGRIWVDHWNNTWRMVVIPKSGQAGGTKVTPLTFSSTTPATNDRFDVKLIITPTGVQCYTRVNPSSDTDDWYPSGSISLTINSTTMDMNSSHKNVYFGGADFVVADYNNVQAGTYDLTKCYLKIDDTTYNMVEGTEGIVATSSQLGIVKPDNTSITIANDGTLSANLTVTNTSGVQYNDGSADYTIVGVDPDTTSVDLGISKSGYKVNMLSSTPLERNHTETIYDTSMDSTLAGLAMPSMNYVDLTWPESGNAIQGIPDQDGYLFLEKNATAVGQTCMIRILDASENFLYRVRFVASTNTAACTYFIPIPKGCIAKVTSTLDGDTAYLRFFTCAGCGTIQQ